jgi:hypothetical protein
MKFWYTLVIALVLSGVMGFTSPCGDPDDPCMDKESWNQCRNLEINGCKSIQVLESCPLQFACGDKDNEKLENDKKNTSNNPPFMITPPHIGDIVGEKPNACVGLYVYEGDMCRSGPPIRVISFPTWTAPGSPCYHDATMQGYSVKDQYCNLKTGNWHETVFVGSNTCHKPHWWWGGKRFNLTFTTDSCINGILLSLKGCVAGPCDASAEL